MKFELDEELAAVEELARDVFAAEAPTDRVRDAEGAENGRDDVLWQTLAETGLLGVSAAEEDGGAGLGFAAAAVVLLEQGRTVAPVPLWSHLVAVEILGRHRGVAEIAALLPGCVDGTTRLTVALEEFDGRAPSKPQTLASQDASGRWLVSGEKALAPGASGVDGVVVSARTSDGPGLFFIPSAAELDWGLVPVTTYDVAGTLTLSNTVGIPLATSDQDDLGVALRLARTALAALQVGVGEGAVAHAATYLSGREQFGRPLGGFQAVQHQLADCWIDLEAMRLTMWQAVADLGEDSASGEAERSSLVAKWWCSQSGLDVVHRVQHLHGGMGVDVDYPVHRHFLWGKQIASTLEGAEAALELLGQNLPQEVGA